MGTINFHFFHVMTFHEKELSVKTQITETSEVSKQLTLLLEVSKQFQRKSYSIYIQIIFSY